MKYSLGTIFCCLNLTFVNAQELLFKQREQLRTILIKEIIETDFKENTRTISLYDSGNRIRSEMVYSIAENILESSTNYKWDTMQLIEADYVSGDFHQKEWITKTDTGFVYNLQFFNGSTRSKKIEPGRLKIGYSEYITDSNLNIIAQVRVDSIGDEIIIYLNGNGNSVKGEYIGSDGKMKLIAYDLPVGSITREFDIGNHHFVDSMFYNQFNFIEFEKIQSKVKEKEDKYLIRFHKKWEYRLRD